MNKAPQRTTQGHTNSSGSRGGSWGLTEPPFDSKFHFKKFFICFIFDTLIDIFSPYSLYITVYVFCRNMRDNVLPLDGYCNSEAFILK